jgi:hypothetical protein
LFKESGIKRTHFDQNSRQKAQDIFPTDGIVFDPLPKPSVILSGAGKPPPIASATGAEGRQAARKSAANASRKR